MVSMGISHGEKEIQSSRHPAIPVTANRGKLFKMHDKQKKKLICLVFYSHVHIIFFLNCSSCARQHKY